MAHKQALKTSRTDEFKPHVVYIKPPGFAVLRETRSAAYARSTLNENWSRGFTDDELAEMIRSGQRIELHYGHLFDDVIVNGDLSTAFEQLLVVARKLVTQSSGSPCPGSSDDRLFSSLIKFISILLGISPN